MTIDHSPTFVTLHYSRPSVELLWKVRVDSSDLQVVSAFEPWFAFSPRARVLYARSFVKTSASNRSAVLLHRLLALVHTPTFDPKVLDDVNALRDELSKLPKVKFLNGSTLDCRSANLSLEVSLEMKAAASEASERFVTQEDLQGDLEVDLATQVVLPQPTTHIAELLREVENSGKD
jgi:hypothetical protein